mmetsp:Transcript_104157/g.282978  ORF Transcript_104157/g.282978 Transcript_104157/m.282978 type:complete len:296 (-) Transcript_104157:149-1036(-)
MLTASTPGRASTCRIRSCFQKAASSLLSMQKPRPPLCRLATSSHMRVVMRASSLTAFWLSPRAGASASSRAWLANALASSSRRSTPPRGGAKCTMSQGALSGRNLSAKPSSLIKSFSLLSKMSYDSVSTFSILNASDNRQDPANTSSKARRPGTRGCSPLWAPPAVRAARSAASSASPRVSCQRSPPSTSATKTASRARPLGLPAVATAGRASCGHQPTMRAFNHCSGLLSKGRKFMSWFTRAWPSLRSSSRPSTQVKFPSACSDAMSIQYSSPFSPARPLGPNASTRCLPHRSS